MKEKYIRLIKIEAIRQILAEIHEFVPMALFQRLDSS